MTLMRKTRTEMAGAWRSLRYDLARPGDEPAGDIMPEADVTSTGMHTFGGATGRSLARGQDYEPRAPRRVAAAAAFVTLAVVGATGTYFAVAGGLLERTTASAGETPLAAPAGEAQREALSNTGMGRGPATTPARTPDQPVPPLPQAAPEAPAPAAPPVNRPAQPGTQPARPGVPVEEDCCLAPPVPTPTSVPTSSSSPSPSDSGSPSPSDTGEPSEQPTADPSTSQSAQQ